MYNLKYIIPGLVVFVLIVTSPVWLNVFLWGSDEPVLVPPPGGEKTCVAPIPEMRAKHMVLLNEWRDDVLRNANRTTVTVDGKTFRKGLQMACMECHSNKETFCDPCHEYASVKPYCWDCHLAPSVAASKKEAH